jgi:hypothetical protein
MHPTAHAGPPVILGSSLSGLLISQALSRAGIDHVLLGEDREPPAIPRLGESLNDTASPELWRYYGREISDCFHYKNHICYFNGNFATLIHLANPRRTPARVLRFAPTRGVPRYPWFGDGLFHLDRCIGYNSLVADAAGLGRTLLGPPQRVIFTHHRRQDVERLPAQWWRHGTNLLRLDREFDGLDAVAWIIPIGRTLSVGISVDADGPMGELDAEVLLAHLERACLRRGLDYRAYYPETLPIQDLRHSYFHRSRAYGQNWLLVGNSFLAAWFPTSAGLWTVTAACGMAERLLQKPGLAAYYEKVMRGIVPFHDLIDGVVHGPMWRSSLHVYRFFSRGSMFIIGRIAAYLRIKSGNFGWLHPMSWFLGTLGIIGYLLPSLAFLLLGGTVVVRSRLSPDRSRQARHFPLYFWTIPFRVVNFFRTFFQFPWAAIPRATVPSPEVPGPPDRSLAAP